MGIGKALWDGTRPALLWHVLASIFGSGVVTALVMCLRIEANSPLTALGAVIIFVVSLLPVAMGIVIYSAREKQRAERDGGIVDTEGAVHHRWMMPLIGIAVTLLF